MHYIHLNSSSDVYDEEEGGEALTFIIFIESIANMVKSHLKR